MDARNRSREGRPIALTYPTVQPWLNYKRHLIDNDWDDLNIITGREGKGKSKWARKVARALDPTFNLSRIHFSWEPYQEAIGQGTRGQCFILDEFRGHSRESMTKDRLSVLDEFKENRGLGLHHFIVFNRFTKLDKDLSTDRVSDWSYIRQRGIVEIRQPHSELIFDQYGQPLEPTTYPLVGKWTFTDWEPPGWASGYKAMKEARMRDRRARQREPESQAPKAIDPAIKARQDLIWADIGQKALG